VSLFCDGEKRESSGFSCAKLSSVADEEDLMVVVMEVGEEGNNNVEYEGADSGGLCGGRSVARERSE